MGNPHSFGRYRVTGVLGAGGMGKVYAAEDEVLGREVAVKTLHSRMGGLGGHLLDERFRLEARAIAALTHPGIVQVYDIDLSADPPYLVMERVSGPSLKERFDSGPMSASEVRALGIQIARALAAAHAAKIVHRDIKPANILIAGAGSWKLADFGVAHVPDSTLTLTGQFVGSPAYAPPEALVRGQSTEAGDVFGLGATLYLAAAGTWPRTDATTSGLLAPVPSLRELAPTLPDDLIATIDRAVSIEPGDRPTAVELADALAGGVAVAHASAPSTPMVPTRAIATPLSSQTTTQGGARTDWRRWAIGGGIALALIAIIASQTTSSGPKSPAPSPTAAKPSDDDPPPGQIRVVPPPMTDPHAQKDWGKLVDKLYDHKFEDARHKLDDWERKWGPSEETPSLRRQLDALPPGEDHGPPPPGDRHGPPRPDDD